MANIQLEPQWKSVLGGEFQKDYMINLKRFLQTEIESHKNLFPRGDEYFAALNLTPFSQVRVVIVGQDPYHGAGQAHGLCFSVRQGVRLPPSLQNIFKELKSDLGLPLPTHGNLTHWAQQGVLLLNSVLTVEEGQAAAHQGQGWEQFTDQVIASLNKNREGIVYILWGSYAQKKAAFVDRKKNLVLEAPHPSPLSAHRGFFGTKPFSKVNTYLESKNLSKIDWKLTDSHSEIPIDSQKDLCSDSFEIR
jgi:uracil-DNA glycosylase